MSLGLVQLAAGFLIGAGLLFLGMYVGLGVREGREADRHARVMLARIEARRTRPVVYLAAPPAAEARPFYRPGYADPFPRAGRFILGPAAVDQAPAAVDQAAEADQLPHGPASRPITSPVDLDGAVRLMCIETEHYVARLIAGTYHAERNGNQ